MSETSEATNTAIGAESQEIDSFAESIFNDEITESEALADDGIDSWEAAENYEAPIQEEVKNEEALAEDSNKVDDADSQPQEEAIEAKDEETPSEDVPDGEKAQEEVNEVSEGDQQPALEKLIESGELELEVKVDGQMEKVSLQELKNNYSGKVAFDKKFTELDRERTTWKKDVEVVNTYINEFASKMKDGDVLGAFQYFGEFANIPPFMLKEHLLHSLGPEIERRMNMSPDQIQNEYVTNHNDYLKKQNESVMKRQAEAQAIQEREAQEQHVRETHSIDADTWTEAKEYLMQESEKQGFEVTPELVSNFIQQEAAGKQAESLLTEFDVSSPSVDEINAIKDIILKNPSFTQDDLKTIMKQVYGEKAAKEEKEIKENLEKRVKKHEAKKPMEQKSEAQGIFNDDGDEITDFEQLF